MSLTHFPNGIGQKIGFGPGAAAGDVTITGGIKAGDKILQVLAFRTVNNAVPDQLLDVTAEFTATADDTINNTGGTSTANRVVCVVWASRGDASL